MFAGKQSLSFLNPDQVPDAAQFHFGIVVSEWNSEITSALHKGCVDFLLKAGASESNLTVLQVPGSYELTMGAALLAKSLQYDAIIALGCVIQGETRHFDFICQAVSTGLTSVGIQYHLPVIFGVLTTDNQDQALARAGGNYGNKGIEAAATAIKMAALFNENSL